MMVQKKIKQTKINNPFYLELYSYRSMTSSLSKWSLTFYRSKRHEDYLRKTMFYKWPSFFSRKWIRSCLFICVFITHFVRSILFGPSEMYNEQAEFGLGKTLDKINLSGRPVFDSQRMDKLEDAYFDPVERKRSTGGYTAEIYWTTSNAAKKICRLRNACIKRDGSLVLHSSLRKHEDEVRQCHTHNLSFLSFSEHSTNSFTYSNVHLIGSWPARFHIPHFLTDVVSAIYSIEFIWPSCKHLRTAYSCFSAFDRSCSALHTESSETNLDNLKTALLVEDRILSMRREEWVPQFASLMFHHPKLVSLQSLYQQDSVQNFHCFKSIVAYDRGKYNLETDWFDDKNRFFHENRLKRNRMGVTPHFTISHKGARTRSEMSFHKSCNATVLILNRSLSQKRSLLHATEIKNRIKERLGKTSEMKVRASIIVEYFENLKFEEQVKNMQKADIIIGAHGAGLANVVFAKQHTFFLEVFPFLYYAGPFKTIAHTMALHYHSYIAYPDFKSFNNCIHDMSRKKMLPNLTLAARKLWDEAVTHNATVTGKLDFSKIDDPLAAYLRFCARQQQLRVNIDAFIGVAIEMTKSFCNF